MTTDAQLAELVGRAPDARLLTDGRDALPPSVGRPQTLPESATRARLVGLGATLTGVTLIGGSVLALVGLIDVVTDGLGALGVIALVIGVLLAATHWGWVHIAEVSADSLEARQQAGVIEARTDWLREIEPYTRWEVHTEVDPEGAITIVRVCYQPVVIGSDKFTFERRVETREHHSGDEPGAEVTERAELMRRDAAVDTERERERYEAAASAYETALMARDDDEQRAAARRAASEALSERINSNLREPPLVE